MAANNVRRYAHEYECPRCGQGSKDLKPEYLAVIVLEFGLSACLRCDICGKQFLAEASPAK